jgi:hypothetical protein
VLDNPLTQSLMSNPDIIRQMLESNPQMQVTSIQPLFDRDPQFCIFSSLWNGEELRQKS